MDRCMITNSVTIIVLEPSEGKVLTNGETFSYKVFLGKNDSPENWYEVDEEEILNTQDEIEE